METAASALHSVNDGEILRSAQNDSAALLPLDLPERIIPFAKGARHVFRRVLPDDWTAFFGAVDAFIEERDGQRAIVINDDAAALLLWSATIARVGGYRASDGRPFEELENWKERVPPAHRIRAARCLTDVFAVPSADEFVVQAEGESVSLSALWSAPSEDAAEVARYSGLLHRFATPDVEQRRRFLRAKYKRFVNKGRTVIPSLQPVLTKLYDEMIVAVEGYAINGHALEGQANIRQWMDGQHKVSACRALFEAGSVSAQADDEAGE